MNRLTIIGSLLFVASATQCLRRKATHTAAPA